MLWIALWAFPAPVSLGQEVLPESLPAVEDAGRHFARILGPLTWREALLLAAFSSIGEELLFRGALWPHLDLIGTSFLFALVHILPKRALWGYPLFALFAATPASRALQVALERAHG